MRIAATHPPSPEATDRFRADGRWPSAGPADLSSGGSRTALTDALGAWSYARLAGAVDVIRVALTRAGVTALDAVLIVAPLRNPAVAAYLGTVRHGSVAVLLDRRCGTSDVRAACAAAQPRVILAFDDDAQRLDLQLHAPVLSLDVLVHAEPTDTAAVDPDAAAVVVFTSGTTEHARRASSSTLNSLRCGTANMVDVLELCDDDALFLSSPLAGITGVLQVESALSVGAKVILVERFSAQTALDDVRAHGATVIGGAPVIAEAIFAEAGRRGLESLPLRCIALGGSMIPASVVADASGFGVRAVRVYGSSEVPFSTATALDAPFRGWTGRCMPGVDVAVGASDELLVRGPHQFHGYLDPAHNNGSFDGDWVRTGDRPTSSTVAASGSRAGSRRSSRARA